MTKRSNQKIQKMLIEKASGERETFSEEKLFHSLQAVGASEELARRVIRLLMDQVGPDITTDKLYRLAFKLLHKEARYLAARYSLRRAIMDLGPSGYPFEKLVAALFHSQGYKTQVDQTLPGVHVNHEVDVVATRGEHRVLVECKYRNNHGRKCDVKVALYVNARWQDLRNNPDQPRIHQFWLATNTKFTRDAIRYSEGVGLKLLGWDYPQGQGLKEQIELSQVHPITCLTTLKARDKKALLRQRVVLCRELADHPKYLDDLRLKDAPRRRILEEISHLTVGQEG